MSLRTLGMSSFFFVVLFVVAVLFAGLPGRAYAVGTAADAMCTEPGMCQYGTRCGKNGPPGVLNKPCYDTTNKYTTNGVCVAPFKCQAQTTNGGSLTSISQLLQGIAQLMQAMKGQGGGGGGGAGTGTEGCVQYTPSSVPTADPCSYYVPGSGSTTSDLFGTTNGSDAASQLISSLSGSTDTVGSNTNSNTDTNTNTNTNTATASTNQNLSPGVSASVSQTAFGSSPGGAGDIQILSGNKVTVLVSNRDVGANRQTSGLYGFTAVADRPPETIFTVLCQARPWAVGFLATILAPVYLDSLCTSHGYSITPPPPPPILTQTSVSAAPQATTTPAVPQYLGPLTAEIWASPPSISSGSRASIFWNSTGALSCKVSSSDNVLTAVTLSGSAASQPLTRNTTFSIACESATSTASNQVVVTVQ
jgi:hypothetical protein